jgi:putative sigma-54 modulation protein
MDYRLITRGFSPSDSIQEYAEKKTSKLEKTLPEGDHVKVEMRLQKEREIFNAELNVFIRGGTLRVEEKTADVYASIDKAIEAMDNKLKRYKTKKLLRHKAGVVGIGEEYAKTAPAVKETESEESIAEVVRTKRFYLKPMGIEEAILQMDMLDHDFYVFKNDVTDEINLVYKRKNGTIGLIEFEV